MQAIAELRWTNYDDLIYWIKWVIIQLLSQIYFNEHVKHVIISWTFFHVALLTNKEIWIEITVSLIAVSQFY